jgi:hypothetical protein
MSSCGILIMSMGDILRSNPNPEMLFSFPRGSGNYYEVLAKGEANVIRNTQSRVIAQI